MFECCASNEEKVMLAGSKANRLMSQLSLSDSFCIYQITWLPISDVILIVVQAIPQSMLGPVLLLLQLGTTEGLAVGSASILSQ